MLREAYRPPLVVLASFALLLPLAGCGQGHAEETPPAQAAPPPAPGTSAAAEHLPPVRVVTREVTLGALEDRLVLVGDVLAETDVLVASELPGKIESFSASEGDWITKGRVLAKIDARMSEAQLAQAEAASGLARKSAERLRALAAERLATPQQLDEADAAVTQAEAAANIARVRVEQAVVEAPVSGHLVRKFSNTGEYAAPGVPLARLVDTHALKLQARISEMDLPFIAAGTPAQVRFDPFPERVFTAKVRHVLPEPDPVSKHYTVELRLDNAKLDIKPGMTARVSFLRWSRENVVAVDQDQVIETDDARRVVFVVVQGHAALRAVELGLHADGRVVVERGLSPGEQLVVVGHRLLGDGQPVIDATH